MTAKEYLSQVYQLDQRINGKLQQISALRSLAEKVTSTIKENNVSCSRNVASLEDTIIRLMESENELNQQIDDWVDLKREVARSISRLDSINYQLVLEKRYLCFLTWKEIAEDLNYSIRWVHTTHKEALTVFDKAIQK